MVAGEHSGDALGAQLMAALDQGCGGPFVSGVGGPLMGARGSLVFPLEDVAVMGPVAIGPGCGRS